MLYGKEGEDNESSFKLPYALDRALWVDKMVDCVCLQSVGHVRDNEHSDV